MPSTPSRRAVLRATLLGLGSGVAGCVSSGADEATQTTAPATGTTDTPSRTATTTPTEASGTFADTPAGPEPYPDRPADPTREAVLSYVQTFEHAIVYNSLHEPDAETISVDCTAEYDVEADGGHYALATCTGYANYADDVHADWGQLPAVYYVSDDATIRVEELDDRYRHYTEVFASDDPDENVEQPGEGRWAGYRVYNMDTDHHELSVTVDFLGGFTPVEAFATEYALGPRAGILQESVTYRRGAYRITARLEDGTQATYRWTVTDDEDYGQFETSIFVTPTGGLTIREPAFDRLR